MLQPKIALIRAEQIVKTYRDNGIQVPALQGIDFTLDAGEFAAIAGPSGSGKTTLLNIISGLDQPTSGLVYLHDRQITAMSGRALSDFRRDNIGFIFQSYNLIPVLSVAENIEYIMLLQKVPARERRRRVEEMLATLGLAGYADRFPAKLSGGQQQRVAIARAMVSKPLLILADEPTANLDSHTGAELVDMMHSLNRTTGMTFLFSTHDPTILAKADRVIVIKDGLVASDERRG
jgi:putative ABC transport system ATP-binding protein